MKYTLVQPPNKEVIDIDSIDISRHYIAFSNKDHDTVGYLVMNIFGDVLRSVVLSNIATNSYVYTGYYKRVLKEMFGPFDIYVFDNRKEFYQFLADNSK